MIWPAAGGSDPQSYDPSALPIEWAAGLNGREIAPMQAAVAAHEQVQARQEARRQAQARAARRPAARQPTAGPSPMLPHGEKGARAPVPTGDSRPGTAGGLVLPSLPALTNLALTVNQIADARPLSRALRSLPRLRQLLLGAVQAD